ncbi:MAG: hypothetical protein LC776_06275 [Acidobacteria bacterium]|nr:hypothetical protein [Acidobacteriota bacterium]
MSDLTRLLTGDRTRANAVVSTPLEQPTRTSQDEMAETVGLLRGVTQLLANDVADVHGEALDIQLESRADEAAKRSVTELLAELAELGFAWRDIARLVGVSIPAIRKWRQGGTITGAHRRAVAHVLAFVDVLRSDHFVQDVPSWMEIPIAGSSSSGIDIYAAGEAKSLLLYAAGHLASEELLDQVHPSWRIRSDDQFEITSGSDGEPIIRMRDPERL